MNRRWIVDLVAMGFLLGVVGGLCGCGGSKETQTMTAAPVIQEDLASKDAAAKGPSFKMELSDLRAALAGSDLRVEVKYRVTNGEANPDQTYTCVVAFASGAASVGTPVALVEKQGKDLGKEGALEGTCQVPQGSPTAFVVRVIDGKLPGPRPTGGIGPRGGGGGGGTPKDVSNQLPSGMPAG